MILKIKSIKIKSISLNIASRLLFLLKFLLQKWEPLWSRLVVRAKKLSTLLAAMPKAEGKAQILFHCQYEELTNSFVFEMETFLEALVLEMRLGISPYTSITIIVEAGISNPKLVAVEYHHLERYANLLTLDRLTASIPRHYHFRVMVDKVRESYLKTDLSWCIRQVSKDIGLIQAGLQNKESEAASVQPDLVEERRFQRLAERRYLKRILGRYLILYGVGLIVGYLVLVSTLPIAVAAAVILVAIKSYQGIVRWWLHHKLVSKRKIS